MRLVGNGLTQVLWSWLIDWINGAVLRFQHNFTPIRAKDYIVYAFPGFQQDYAGALVAPTQQHSHKKNHSPEPRTPGSRIKHPTAETCRIHYSLRCVTKSVYKWPVQYSIDFRRYQTKITYEIYLRKEQINIWLKKKKKNLLFLQCFQRPSFSMPRKVRVVC